MKTKFKSCFYCLYNDKGGEVGGERDEDKGICFRCTNFSNCVDIRDLKHHPYRDWPIEDELIGRGD